MRILHILNNPRGSINLPSQLQRSTDFERQGVNCRYRICSPYHNIKLVPLQSTSQMAIAGHNLLSLFWQHSLRCLSRGAKC